MRTRHNATISNKARFACPPTPTALVLVSMAATAYLSHFNAPDFLHDLEDNTLPRFKKLVTRGFGITAIISAAMMSFGFLTFGGGEK